MPWDGVERRKAQRPPNNFTPSGAFEGYVYAKLESINQRLDNLPCLGNSERINEIESEVSNIKGKTTIIGTIAGFLAGLVTKYIFGK